MKKLLKYLRKTPPEELPFVILFSLLIGIVAFAMVLLTIYP